MKFSIFNTLFTSNEGISYIHNSMSNCMLDVNEEIFNFIKTSNNQNKIELPENLFDKETIDTLLSAKILTLSDSDEMNKLHTKILINRFDRTKMNLTIAPTQACNFDCTYCYEIYRPKISMDEQTEDKIIQLIKVSNPKKLNINWYGGEPLLKTDTIKKISEELNHLNINYNASIITNGYLLKKNIIDQLNQWKIQMIQITLDGPKEVHDSRRFLLNGNPTFNKIKQNILNLLSSENSKDLLIKIRVNLDKDNHKEFITFRDHLVELFKKHDRQIEIYPGWVTGESNPNIPCLTQPEISKFMLANSNKFYPDNTITECMARHINSFLIGPKGGIYKCWHNLGNPELCLGNLNDEELIINEKLLSRFVLGTDPYFHDQCKQCSILPICWGGCPMERYDNKYNNANHNTCNKYKDNIEEFLIKHVNKLKS